MENRIPQQNIGNTESTFIADHGINGIELWKSDGIHSSQLRRHDFPVSEAMVTSCLPHHQVGNELSKLIGNLSFGVTVFYRMVLVPGFEPGSKE